MLRTGGRNEEDYERRTTSDWPAPAFAIFGHIYTILHMHGSLNFRNPFCNDFGGSY